MDDISQKFDFIVVGGVATGPKAAATLARRFPDAGIILFQNEEYLSYASCGLSYFASGDIDSFEELIRTPHGVIRDSEFFEKSKGFKAVTGAEVIDIDRGQKTVDVRYSATGNVVRYEYGKLILATGATGREPGFPVVKSPRVSSFRKPADAAVFRKSAEAGQIDKAIIVGGGFIGCELAEATGGLWGIDTVLIERENQVLPGLLDGEMAAIVQKHMTDRGVKVVTAARPEKIDLDDNDHPMVWLESKEKIGGDYVFLCLGCHPETSLAERCGLDRGETGGILVDEYQCTSDPDIYAGGDCVEQTARITGRKIHMPMGSLANRHGRFIAENLAGNSCEFPGILGTFLLKVFDINVGAVGLTARSAREVGIKVAEIWGTFPDKPDYIPEVRTVTLKMIYDSDDGRLLGLQAVGQADVCRFVDVFSCFMQNSAVIDDLFDFEHGYAPPYSEPMHPFHHLASMANAKQKGMDFLSPGIDLATQNGGAVILDMREEEESSDNPLCSIFPGLNLKTMNIPLNDLTSRIGELDRGSRHIVVCKRGSRSYQAAVILKSRGFTDIGVLGGGLIARG
jgi:NADPH-dependent 2,4-dienoyl-CoA reductase/sulfur reductase-like enzyme/rhodanese-related sulfurtransferase